MRRSRRVDWLLFATLLPLYGVMQAGGIQAHLASGERGLPFRLSGAQGAHGYPIVLGLRTPHAEIQRGDRVLHLGDLDLQGLSRIEIERRTVPLLRAGLPFNVDLERGGARFITRAEPAPFPSWFWPIPVWLAWVAVSTFLLLRAPHWHLARHFFVLCVALACFGTTLGPSPLPERVFGIVVAFPVFEGLALWFLLAWRESARPGPWALAVSLAVGLAAAASWATGWALTLPTGATPDRLSVVVTVVFIALSLAALVRVYRRSEPLERRKLRWILYAHFLGAVPIGLVLVLQLLLPVLGDRSFAIAWIFLAAIPVGYGIAIAGYGWLDVDRVISASAAATVVGIALVGGVLAVVPPVARAASAPLGVDPETGRLALSMALAAVLVPAYRGLRPWLDRRLFAERFELAQGFERLRAELGACRSVEEMATCAGRGFDTLLHPESIAIYGRAGEAFTPLFVRGRALPPAFEVGSTLVQVLEAKAAPLFARARELGPFERAALDTLGAEVVVPQLREKQLLAFTCLGGKRSGDIYTASDLALLGASAERCAEVIARLDLETLAREAQALQSALRRYVPGAVADRVLAGDALEPAEREVSVLFVDIRGYTSVAERLQASEVFATLNEHTERVSRIVQESGGTIVEFNGDGLMAVFGAPEALAKKEQQAVEAARRIVDSMPDTLAVGVGIATGNAFVGSIRSTDRLIWTAVGSTANVAARLQSMTRELGASIALDEATRQRARYVCADFVRHTDVAIRGRLGRYEVFALPL
jgi:class 3 adenylate cyclase